MPVNEIFWVRLPHPDINEGEEGIGNSAYINETLHNSGADEVTVTYLITLKMGDCIYENISELTVTVYPGIELAINPVVPVCINDKTANIEYSVNIESAEYKLEFGVEGLAAGFNNIPYTSLPVSAIEIPIPQGVKTGNYPAVISVRFGDCEATYNIVIVVDKMPMVTSVSQTDWILCENKELYLFVEVDGNAQYQWEYDGNPIQGATNSYYEILEDNFNTGIYAVKISNNCGTIRYEFNVQINPLVIETKYDDVIYVDNIGDLYVSYQWYKNGKPISLYGNSQYYTEPGGFTPLAEYSLRAYKADGSYDEACPVVPNVTPGIKSLFQVYPNPAQNGSKITILLRLANESEIDATALIVDMTGRLVKSYHLTDYLTEIPVDFAAAPYTVKVITKSGKEFIEKIIIKK
jgi:hypothetical protein